MRTIHNFVQGSPEWHAHRAKCDNASDASAAMNDSAYTTRSELLRRRASGVEKEYDAATLARFAKGHELEAQARVWAEEIIGEALYPMTMSEATEDGLLLSASFDGLTMLEDVAWEHKTLNANLAGALKQGIIPREYFWQMEQGLLISGAEKCLFMASNGTKDSMLHAWYYQSPDVRKQLLAGWKQFHKDLDAYQHVEVVAAPVAASIDALPALFVQVEGKVLATNLDAFKASAQTFIDGIKTELVNDQDFADADKMVKFLKDGEERLALAKSQALAQTASIDELFRTIDSISGQMRDKRLALDKLVTAEKINRKAAILNDACVAIASHVNKLNERIGGRWMPVELVSAARFAESTKGLKSLDSMRDKVDGALAKAKIEANEIADVIEENYKRVSRDGNDYTYLFPDFAAVCTKPADDFINLFSARVQEEERRRDAEREALAAKQAAMQKPAEPVPQATLDLSQPAGAVLQPAAIGAPVAMPQIDIVTEYLQLLAISAVEKKALRIHLEKFVKYWQAKTRMDVTA